MKLLFSFFLAFSLSSVLFGQTILENNAPSVKWRQVNTPHFRVIFPNGFNEEAQRVANTLEHIHESEARSLGTRPRKISVILQNQSSISNAFVSWLPRRSEFYTMPPQDYNFIGNNDWLDMLAAHEYRHIVQFSHANRGFNRLLYYAFGALTFVGMAQAAAPDWFWEGDAVVTETAFTRTGRGKIPRFSLTMRSNLLEGREFNYHKQSLRSYKHQIPDEYVLGYHMVSYLRKRTGDPEIWGKISARAWNIPFIPFAFSNAIKKESGLYVTQLYREMAKDLRKELEQELQSISLTPFERFNSRRGRAYTDYLYPQPQPDGSVIALKKGIGDIETFVRIKGAEEKVRNIFPTGYFNDAGMLSVVNGKIVWNEYGFDPRWRVRTYSLIKTFDADTRARRIVGSNRDRYGSASLSPDGRRVATVRTDADYRTQLVVLNYESGAIEKEFPNPENNFYSMPRWSDDGASIAVIITSKSGKTISIVDADDGSKRDVLSVTEENVGHPVLSNGFLFFNSPITGIDNIFAINLANGERLQVTSSRHGAYNPAVSADKQFIYYNDQTRDGLDIVRIPFEPSQWQKFIPQPVDNSLYAHLVEQEGHSGVEFQNVPSESLPVTRYSKLRGVINPYTWGLNVETDLTRATVGISSRDILNTMALGAGYEVDINERTGSWYAEASYQGFFPVIDVRGKIANRAINEGPLPYERIVGSDTVSFVEDLTFKWSEINVEGGLRLPLVLTNSRFSTSFIVSNYVGYTQVKDFENSIYDDGTVFPPDLGGGRIIPANLPQYFFRDYVGNGALIYNNFNLVLSRLLKQSRRDINSKWGQQIFLSAYGTPYQGSDYAGGQFSFYGVLYLPGFFKHHSIWGYWAYQHTKVERANITTREGLNNYLFRNRVPLPRGQSVSRFQDFYSMSVNYTLPVWYPDIALGPILNFQRIRANVFLDYGFGQSKLFESSGAYTSVGAEVRLDLNIMRFYPQFDIGVRYTKGLDPATSEVELLLGTFNF